MLWLEEASELPVMESAEELESVDVAPEAFGVAGSESVLAAEGVSSLSGFNPHPSHFQPPGLETGSCCVALTVLAADLSILSEDFSFLLEDFSILALGCAILLFSDLLVLFICMNSQSRFVHNLLLSESLHMGGWK